MLTDSQIDSIKKEVERVANKHLEARDADTALGHFVEDVIAVSNVDIFPSKESLALDVRNYYACLKQVDQAGWEDIYINVVSEAAATFTAKFRYEFTTTDNSLIKLRGVWTALFVLADQVWKIKMRHESFEQIQ